MKFINQSNEPPPLHLPLVLGDKRGENDTISDERISDSFFQIKSAVVAFYLFSRAILFTRTLFLANLIFLSFRSTTNDAPEPRPARCRFFARNETTLAGIKTYEYLTDRAVLNLSYACTLPEEKLLLTGPGGLAPENSLGFFCSRPRFFPRHGQQRPRQKRDKCLPLGKEQPLLVARRSRREKEGGGGRRIKIPSDDQLSRIAACWTTR